MGLTTPLHGEGKDPYRIVAKVEETYYNFNLKRSI
jgi:hypothetical protein